MRTNIEIDDELMADLMDYTGLKTKKAVVDLALRELRRKKGVEDILALAGKVEFWPGYDPEEGDDEHADWDWHDEPSHR